ncbi:MAG: molybdopterin molybdotransferase MoeA [Desulfobulbaceae bacterium]|nr:molybdopterin molybdotransferase MoeA [Desulfobulbaceae bacterium]
MNINDKKTFSFQRAQQAIPATIQRLPDESVVLSEATQRITSADVLAVTPQPSFDESTRDGYVIEVIDGSDERVNRYRIADEIPAGKPSGNILEPGTACRIMTGGCVPEGSTRVVPYENCVEQNGSVIIEDSALQASATFIRKTGSEIAQGEKLVAAGVALQGGHLALLASCGVQFVSVVARPSVGYVCTGSELTTTTEGLEIGQKVSSNSFHLEGLLASVGALPGNFGVINDSEKELLNLFAQVRSAELDMMITTGGMGPGKYDLVERAFAQAGGEVIFNAISMRPGKSILFGTLGRTLFFGLPGPPHAVRTLLNTLVGPTLLAMQGVKGSWPKKVQAHLQHQSKVKRNDVLRLKDGVLMMEEGSCSVRFAGGLEVGNCFILLPPGRAHYDEGELVEVYLVVDLSESL